jgi:medium-chain acyl-[acyl-carrier-protein] hydrolase
MKTVDIWTDNYIVRSYQSDQAAKLHIHSIGHYLQESAWKHAEACGVGYSDLLKLGKIWILSGLKIKVYDYPLWGDKLKLNTWGNNIEGLFAYRDFEIFNSSGEIVIAASTSWLIIDNKTHRPSRITEEFQKIPCRGIYSGSGQPTRLPAIKTGSSVGSLIVQYSDIDIYRHVNNARYIEWCVNRLPLEFLNENPVEGLEINYLSECHLGQEVTFYMENHSDFLFRLSAHNLSTVREVFRAELLVKK